MHSLSGRQLLTCRYWAFGPGCPDVDAHNVQTCPYAHWDTGRLVDFYEQRGTCYDWFHKRVCPFGISCSYEHRDTGVMGLNQGMLVLHGLNLEIADAANRSGFNTRNQVALMDLIWAVRRIAFRHAVERPRIQRPPKHPIYPDRYRPGDPSDNTMRPRKRGREPEAQVPGKGTRDNPIEIANDNLEAGEGGTTANSSAKRLKVAVGQIGRIGRHQVELPSRAKVLNPVHPTKFQGSSNARHERGRAYARKTSYMPCPGPLDLPPPRPSSVGPIFNTARPLVPGSRDRTVVGLRKVGNTLQDNIDAVIECSRVMKAMYERDDRLGNDIIYKELGSLKETFDSCLGDAEVGIVTINKVIGLLEDNKDHVMASGDQRL
ncbi:hypothetical protein GJ744_007009 [Endocarpon pusillum]|uniref:C3H1-type domain-containing protein n=1 Tax=Endocarpon pusillum TaxID=364733 RepID=A0A8H7AS24_9EURO|nr:hypothetical protein GJ744_007009 [Endocarpon pusillum]